MGCKYFGVRSSRAVCVSRCTECARSTQCFLETNTLLATSISVDDKGNTIRSLSGKVPDDRLLTEDG